MVTKKKKITFPKATAALIAKLAKKKLGMRSALPSPREGPRERLVRLQAKLDEKRDSRQFAMLKEVWGKISTTMERVRLKQEARDEKREASRRDCSTCVDPFAIKITGRELRALYDARIARIDAAADSLAEVDAEMLAHRDELVFTRDHLAVTDDEILTLEGQNKVVIRNLLCLPVSFPRQRAGRIYPPDYPSDPGVS